jgi:hypothetical protein
MGRNPRRAIRYDRPLCQFPAFRAHMKNRLALLLLAAPALVIAGCGVTAIQTDAAAQPEQRVYTTGSNIARRPTEGPRSDEVTTVGRDAADRQLDVRGVVPPKPPGGG